MVFTVKTRGKQNWGKRKAGSIFYLLFDWLLIKLTGFCVWIWFWARAGDGWIRWLFWALGYWIKIYIGPGLLVLGLDSFGKV